MHGEVDPATNDRPSRDDLGAAHLGRHAAPPSARSTTSGSSVATSASKSPSRAAARNASTTSRWRLTSTSGVGGLGADAAAGPAGQLAGRLGERSRRVAISSNGTREHVVQHEGEPLGWCQCLEHDEQREPDRVGKQRLVLGIDAVGGVDDRVGKVRTQRLLAAYRT